MVVRSLGLIVVVWAILCGGAAAEEAPRYEVPEFMKEPPALPAGVDASAVWRLDLTEALRIAMHDNLGIAIERETLQIARLGVRVARGAFEPLLGLSFAHAEADSPPLTRQEGGAGMNVHSTTDDWVMSLSQRLQTGTQLRLEFDSLGSDSTAGTAVAEVNYRSTLRLSLTQPLLRGFSPDLVVPRIDVLRAEIASERERQQLAVAAADLVVTTEAAYWDVVQTLYSYNLQLRSRQRAEDQLALTRRQIDAGLLPPSDLLSAEATLAQRKLDLLQAEQAIEAVTDRLRGVLNLPREQWARPILPTDAPAFAAETHRAEDLLAMAIKHRPELAQSELDQRAAELSARRADNDRLPQIDVGLNATVVGQDDGYIRTLEQLGRATAPGYAVSVNLTWTPLGRATGAAAEIERARQRNADAARSQLIQNVWLAVREAVRNQHSAALQVAAAARFRDLATKNLEIEQRKFLNSESTNFLVAQRQGDLAAAQLAELNAVLSHKKATAALSRSTGALLDERHIQLDVAPARSQP